MKERLRIVLASRFLLGYPEGGGHWSAFLQHLQGLDALGHDVFWLELYRPGAESRVPSLERAFGERMDAMGFAGRCYIAASRAELCCPKPVYAELRTGWYSDRSACFLASGRPVIMQDTGVEGHLPLGAGLLAFSDLETAVAAVETVEGNYAAHSLAARHLALEHLGATRVLGDMLEVCR